MPLAKQGEQTQAASTQILELKSAGSQSKLQVDSQKPNDGGLSELIKSRDPNPTLPPLDFGSLIEPKKHVQFSAAIPSESLVESVDESASSQAADDQKNELRSIVEILEKKLPSPKKAEASQQKRRERSKSVFNVKAMEKQPQSKMQEYKLDKKESMRAMERLQAKRELILVVGKFMSKMK